MSTKEIALLFRTHFTNAMVEEGYHWLKEQVPENVDVIFTCDETRGNIVAPADALKFGHNEEDIERMGLLSYPKGKLLWYNIDYPFYFFYDQFPDYDLYLMVEYDVFFDQGSVEKLIRFLQNSDADFYTAYYRKCGPEWYWYSTGRTFCKEVYQSFFPVAGLSNEAIRYLFSKRIEQTEFVLDGSVDVEKWPFGEAFVPSELTAAGFDISSLDVELGFAGPGFTFENLQCLDFLDRTEPSLSIRHPVMDKDGFVQKLLARTEEEKLKSFLSRLPDVHETLCRFDREDLQGRLDRFATKAQKKQVLSFYQG